MDIDFPFRSLRDWWFDDAAKPGGGVFGSHQSSPWRPLSPVTLAVVGGAVRRPTT